MVQERFVTCAMCHMFPLLFLLQHHEAHEVDVFCLFIRCFCSNRMNIDPFRYSRGFLSWYDHATRCPRATRCPLIPSFCSNSSRWAFCPSIQTGFWIGMVQTRGKNGCIVKIRGGTSHLKLNGPSRRRIHDSRLQERLMLAIKGDAGGVWLFENP